MLRETQVRRYLQAGGYRGAYDSVQRYVKHWKAQSSRSSSSRAFVPLRMVYDNLAPAFLTGHCHRPSRAYLIAY